MKFGMIGLGKMGGNLARNMKDKGVGVVVYDYIPDKVNEMIAEGFEGAFTLTELATTLGEEGIYWLMIPAGPIVDQIIQDIMAIAQPNALIIDGGNSNYKDTLRRATLIAKKGFRYMDIGTSGGQKGARYGACMMAGGMKKDYKSIESELKAICVPYGVNYMGKNGTGHYVKMIHNGIEYGMMQAIAEGFEILEHSDFNFDLSAIAKVWQNGSIISSYLVEKASDALSKSPDLSSVKDVVDSSGEGLWTVEEALALKLPAYVITASLFKRYESKQTDRFSNKLLAAMRNEFGGHPIHKVGD